MFSDFKSGFTPPAPLSEAEFRSYMDGLGRIIQPLEF